MDGYKLHKDTDKLLTLNTKRERRKLIFEWIKTGYINLKEFGAIANIPNLL